jgi:hypothetical protein
VLARRGIGDLTCAAWTTEAARASSAGTWLIRRLLADGIARHSTLGKVALVAAAWGHGCRLGPAAGLRHTWSLDRGGMTLGVQTRNLAASSSAWSGRTWRRSSSESHRRWPPARGEMKKGSDKMSSVKEYYDTLLILF